MRKWPGRIFVGVSLLLLAGVAGAWAASQGCRVYVVFPVWIGAGDRPSLRYMSITNFRGSFSAGMSFEGYGSHGVFSGKPIGAVPPDLEPFRYHFEPPESFEKRLKALHVNGSAWEHSGFAWTRIPSDAPGYRVRFSALTKNDYQVLESTYTALALPWWFLTLCFSLVPTRALWKRKRARTRQPHHCPACGYDLRATPDPAGPGLPACPECGLAAGGGDRA